MDSFNPAFDSGEVQHDEEILCVFLKAGGYEEVFMTIKDENTPARLAMYSAMLGMLIIISIPDHLQAFWFGALGQVVIVGILTAVIASALVIIKKEPEGPKVIDKMPVRSVVIRITLFVLTMILTGYLLRMFLPAVFDNLNIASITVSIMLFAAIIISILRARRRGWGGI